MQDKIPRVRTLRKLATISAEGGYIHQEDVSERVVLNEPSQSRGNHLVIYL